jgi:hypothetical protein
LVADVANDAFAPEAAHRQLIRFDVFYYQSLTEFISAETFSVGEMTLYFNRHGLMRPLNFVLTCDTTATSSLYKRQHRVALEAGMGRSTALWYASCSFEGGHDG